MGIPLTYTLSPRTGRLFAGPSILAGTAKLIDIGATFDDYNNDSTSKEADFWSLWSDWSAVGDDLQQAFSEHTTQFLKE